MTSKKWTQRTLRNRTVMDLSCNNLMLATVFELDNGYAVSFHLSSLRDMDVYGETTEEVQRKVERLVEQWITSQKIKFDSLFEAWRM